MAKLSPLAALMVSVALSALFTGCNPDVRPADDDDCVGAECTTPDPDGSVSMAVTADADDAQIDVDPAELENGQFVLVPDQVYDIYADADGFDHPLCDARVQDGGAEVSLYNAPEWAAMAGVPEVQTFTVPNGGTLTVELTELTYDGATLDCYTLYTDGDGVEHEYGDGPTLELDQVEGGQAVDIGGGTLLYVYDGRFLGGNATQQWDLQSRLLGNEDDAPEARQEVLEGTSWHEDFPQEGLPYRCYVDVD